MKQSEQIQILAKALYDLSRHKDQQQTQDLVLRFCNYLVSKHLEYLLPKVIEQVKFLDRRAKGLFKARIDSRHELDEGELNKIKTFLESRNKNKVFIEQNLDKNILGGLVVRYQDKLIDLSLNRQLNNLVNQLST